MFLKNFNLIFVIFTITGTIMAISSNSLFMCWLGLEINLMSIIPLMIPMLNKSLTEAAIKYFIVQAVASILIIFFSSLNLSINFNLMNFNILIYSFMIAIAIKSGMAPFHFWFPQIMPMMNWTMTFFMFIWQKIAPFILFNYFFMKPMILFLIMASSIIGGLGGLNQLKTKLILTYSSITHSSWMLMMTSLNLFFWLNYFLIYSFILSSLIMIFSLHNFTNMKKKIPSMKMNIFNLALMMNVLSLGGLPPFLGFYAKMKAMLLSINFYPLGLIMVMLMASVMSLFYYMKMIYNFMMNFSITNKINLLNLDCLNFNSKNYMMLILSISLFTNLMTPFLVLLT